MLAVWPGLVENLLMVVNAVLGIAPDVSIASTIIILFTSCIKRRAQPELTGVVSSDPKLQLVWSQDAPGHSSASTSLPMRSKTNNSPP